MKRFLSVLPILFFFAAAEISAQGRLHLDNGNVLTGDLRHLQTDTFRFQPRWSENEIRISTSGFQFFQQSRPPAPGPGTLPAWRLELHGGLTLMMSSLRWESSHLLAVRPDGTEWSIPGNAILAVLPVRGGTRSIWAGVPSAASWRTSPGADAKAIDTPGGLHLQAQTAWGLSTPHWPKRFHLLMELKSPPPNNPSFLNFSILGQSLELRHADSLFFQMMPNRISLSAATPHPQRPELTLQNQIWQETVEFDLSKPTRIEVYGDTSNGRFFLFLNGTLVKQWVQKDYKISMDDTTRCLSLNPNQNNALLLHELRLSSWDGHPPRSTPLSPLANLTRVQTVSGELLQGALLSLNQEACLIRTEDGIEREVKTDTLLRLVPPAAPAPAGDGISFRASFGDFGESIILGHVRIEDGALFGTLYQQEPEVRIPLHEIRLLQKQKSPAPPSERKETQTP